MPSHRHVPMPLLNQVKHDIHQEFKTYTQHEERQEMISYLLFLGIRYYHLIYPNQPVIRRLAVSLCGKCFYCVDLLWIT